MQWYVTASLALTGGSLVGVLGLLALTSFYVYDGNKSIPSVTSDDWMVHVIALIPLTAVFALSSVYAVWVILSKNRKWLFVGLLIWNLKCLLVCIYFTVAFSLQLDQPKIVAAKLFNKTNTTIFDHSIKEHKDDYKFIPIWLDNIQNKSKTCCGINTFRDWETLWPNASSEVPKSCCKEPENKDKCLTNLASLPFPTVPSMFLKTEQGCIDEINTYLRKNISDCWVYMIIVCILYFIAEVLYGYQFYYDYGKNSPNYQDDSQLPGSGSSGGFFSRMRLGKKNKKDLEAAKDGGDLYNINDGSVTNASGYTASQGTLPDGSQDPLYRQDQLVSGSSSGSELDINGQPVDGAKKKKKRRKKKNKQESGVGSDDGQVNRQEVFVVPDNTGAQSDDLLALNGYDASPTGSQDEVGDKLAPGARDKRGIVGKIGGGVGYVGKGVFSGASTVGTGLATGATSVGKGVASGATTVGKGVASGATTVGKGVASGATAVGKGVATGATAVGQGLGKVGSGIGQGLGKLGNPFRKKGTSPDPNIPDNTGSDTDNQQ